MWLLQGLPRSCFSDRKLSCGNMLTNWMTWIPAETSCDLIWKPCILCFWAEFRRSNTLYHFSRITENLPLISLKPSDLTVRGRDCPGGKFASWLWPFVPAPPPPPPTHVLGLHQCKPPALFRLCYHCLRFFIVFEQGALSFRCAQITVLVTGVPSLQGNFL